MATRNYYNFFLSSLSVLTLIGCTPTTTDTSPTTPTVSSNKELNLTPTSFTALPEWNTENFQNFSTAFNKSCARILKKNSQSNFTKDVRFGRAQDWQVACRKFDGVAANDSASLRSFFEQNFTPYRVAAGNDDEGLFTGYYEASLNGSLTRQGAYQTPLRARPDDLVMVNLGNFRDELKGQRIAGRVIDGRLKPYEDHAEIISGKLPAAQDRPLVWVDSAIDAFFLQIQGSGIVSLDDGRAMRVGYDGQNGHAYYAIGRELVKRGELSKDEVSLQTIESWLEANPDQAEEVMTLNKSYVFFRQLDGNGPVGGEGITLTPMRSLAVDHSLVPYGMPIWLSAETPNQQDTMNRLMVSQDTGGAIRGPVRGDFFWGYGSEAEAQAGAMKSNGRYWFLLPNSI